MKINTFFEETLKAPCANRQWSWGAFDRANGRVFLRVWADEIREGKDGETVQVHWKNYKRDSNGDRERLRHLDAIKAGAEAYGIVCNNAPNHSKGDRKILDFDEKELLKLGNLFIEKDETYAHIESRVPTVNILPGESNSERIVSDIESIQQDAKTSPTTKEALVAARIGQGAFRDEILKNWEHKCAVTGSTTLKIIRASHIKPWRLSSDSERLDSCNGIPLVANFDALFDAGLITFDSRGHIQISPTLSDTEVDLLQLKQKSLRRPPTPKTNSYLAFHRTEVFVK